MTNEKTRDDIEAAIALARQLQDMRNVVGKTQREVLSGWIVKWAVLAAKIDGPLADEDETSAVDESSH